MIAKYIDIYTGHGSPLWRVCDSDGPTTATPTSTHSTKQQALASANARAARLGVKVRVITNDDGTPRAH